MSLVYKAIFQGQEQGTDYQIVKAHSLLVGNLFNDFPSEPDILEIHSGKPYQRNPSPPLKAAVKF